MNKIDWDKEFDRVDKVEKWTLVGLVVGLIIKLGVIGFVLYLAWVLVTGLVA